MPSQQYNRKHAKGRGKGKNGCRLVWRPVQKPACKGEACSDELEQPEFADLCSSLGKDAFFQYDLGPGISMTLQHLPASSQGVLRQIGWTLWPCGRLLAHYVHLRLARRLRGIRVLELGCGAAPLPGLVAASVGAQVVLTDLPEVVEVARQNASRNGLEVKAQPLEWSISAPIDWNHERFDLVIAADVLYDAGNHGMLAATLDWATAVEAPAIIAAQCIEGNIFFTGILPECGWEICRLDIEDVFDTMDANNVFRSNFSIWVCWRQSQTKPDWCGPSTGTKPDWCGALQTDAESDTSSELPWAPPEEDEFDDDDDEPLLAPPESEDEIA